MRTTFKHKAREVPRRPGDPAFLPGRPFDPQTPGEPRDLLRLDALGERARGDPALGKAEISDVPVTRPEIEQDPRSGRTAPHVDPPITIVLDEGHRALDRRAIRDDGFLPVSVPDRDHLDAVCRAQVSEVNAFRVRAAARGQTAGRQTDRGRAEP